MTKNQFSGLSLFFALFAIAGGTLVTAATGGLRRLQCQETKSPTISPADTPAPTSAPTSAPTERGLDCFSADTKVFVRDVGPVTMAELSVGQEILVGFDTTFTNDGLATNRDKFQRVYGFAHREEDIETKFIQIYTDLSDYPLEVTGRHLIFLHGKRNPIRADAIREGDILQGHAIHKGARVKNIQTITKTGLYNPLTHDGKLVAEGVAASCYISLQTNAAEFVEFSGGIPSGVSQHHAIHMSLSPFRVICRHFPSLNSCQLQMEIGMPQYVESGLRLSRWLDGLGYATQRTMFWPFMMAVGSSMLLELER